MPAYVFRPTATSHVLLPSHGPFVRKDRIERISTRFMAEIAVALYVQVCLIGFVFAAGIWNASRARPSMVIIHMVNVSQLQLLEYLPATSVSKTSSENATMEQTTCGIGSRVSDSYGKHVRGWSFPFPRNTCAARVSYSWKPSASSLAWLKHIGYTRIIARVR